MTDTVGNVPPQAVELEEAVLGALMLEKDCIITVQEFVSPEAFYTEEHRLIYKAINELSMELKPIDLYTVTERLKAKKELKKVGGASYLAQLTQKVGSAANVEFHAKIIAQKYVQGHPGPGADADRGGVEEHQRLQRRAVGLHGSGPRDAGLAAVRPDHRRRASLDG